MASAAGGRPACAQVDETAAERVERLMELVRKLTAENDDLRRAKELGVDDSVLATSRGAVDVRWRGWGGWGGGGSRSAEGSHACARVHGEGGAG